MKIYTDGAYSSKTNFGGWAVVITQENFIIEPLTGYEENTTNNRMELTAVLEALKYLYNNIPHTHYLMTFAPSDISIYTDSAYIANAFRDKWYEKWESNGWKTANRTPVLNKDLWEQILNYYRWLEEFVKIEKIDGHNGNDGNELADHLAVGAREKGFQLKTESGL